MRFALPSLPRRSAPPSEPDPPAEAALARPAPPLQAGQPDVPGRRPWIRDRLGRYRALAGLLAAGAAAVSLCFGLGWGMDADPVQVGHGTRAVDGDRKAAADQTGADAVPNAGATAGADADAAANARATADAAANARTAADRARTAADKAAARRAADRADAQRAAAEIAAADRAAAKRAADDKAAAAKVLAAKDADAKAAAARAARAKTDGQEQIVTMPALAGLKLNVARDVAAKAGLTGITVCHTPDGDTPLWWSNWRVVAQDVPAGTRVGTDRFICLSAVPR